jgi:hypothetical protein
MLHRKLNDPVSVSHRQRINHHDEGLGAVCRQPCESTLELFGL